MFEKSDLPLTDKQLHERERWMMEEGNWRDDHSVPSAGEHYRYMWKWDSTKAVTINARRDDPDRAATELSTLLTFTDPNTGFIPNKIFATADKKTWRDYPEAWFFNNNKVGTSYSQPPLEAWAALETYESYTRAKRYHEGVDFLRDIYGSAESGDYTGLQGSYAYFINHRENSNSDPLIGIVHPNETGRDSDEANKPWIATNPNTKFEWLRMQKFGFTMGRRGRDAENQRVDWIPEQVRDEYWVNDVMFNSLHAHGLHKLADVADILHRHSGSQAESQRYRDDRDAYNQKALTIESAILDNMWDEETGFFYNLDSNGNKIPVESITGLFPLLLDSIDESRTTSLLEKLEDPSWFATEYPIPTHAATSKFYRPNPTGAKNAFTPQWSGPVWTDMNHLIAEEGLVARAEQHPNIRSRLLGRASIIASQTHKLLASNHRSMEYYSPENAVGMRVADFMWTNLGLHFEKTDNK